MYLLMYWVHQYYVNNYDYSETYILVKRTIVCAVSLAAAATNARLAEGTHNIISTTSVVHTTTTTTEVRSESRTNKKSKWDKAGHH